MDKRILSITVLALLMLSIGLTSCAEKVSETHTTESDRANIDVSPKKVSTSKEVSEPTEKITSTSEATSEVTSEESREGVGPAVNEEPAEAAGPMMFTGGNGFYAPGYFSPGFGYFSPNYGSYTGYTSMTPYAGYNNIGYNSMGYNNIGYNLGYNTGYSGMTPYAGYTVMTSSNPSLGNYLTDGKGMTLYHLINDQDGYTTTCTSADCIRYWPPFYASSINVPGNLNPGDFRTIVANGRQQTAFKGWALFYFSGDTAPGQTNGQSLKDAWGTWYAVNPESSSTFPPSYTPSSPSGHSSPSYNQPSSYGQPSGGYSSPGGY